MERFKELRARVRAAHGGHRLAVKRQSVVMVILIGPPDDAQAVLLVLYVTPQQVVERAERVDFEHRERIMITAIADVLETAAQRVHGLHQHAFLMPVGPYQFKQTRLGELGSQETEALFGKLEA